MFYVGGNRRNIKDEIYCLYSSTSKVSPCLLSLCCEEVLWRMKKQWGQFCFTLETLSAGLEGQKKRWDRACRLFPGYFHSLEVLKTSLELRMLSRSLSDSQSLTLNVMITFSQVVRNCELCIIFYKPFWTKQIWLSWQGGGQQNEPRLYIHMQNFWLRSPPDAPE